MMAIRRCGDTDLVLQSYNDDTLCRPRLLPNEHQSSDAKQLLSRAFKASAHAAVE